MSVIMMMRVQGSPADLEAYSAANPGTFEHIAQESKAAGAAHHAFAGGNGEVVVIDEWPDEASFQKFFNSHPDIPKLLQEAGAQGKPEVRFYRKMETGDSF